MTMQLLERALAMEAERAAANTHWHASKVSAETRGQQLGLRPATIWLTGLSGAGKSTVAYELEHLLVAEGRPAFVLDGDNLRHHLNRDLGFSAEDRRENIRRSAEVAKLMNDAGLVVIGAFISPSRADRELAGQIIGPAHFIEVHLSTPLAVCEARDPKGLYAKARAGQIPGFTGISAPYEAPLAPALTLDTAALSLSDATAALHAHLCERLR